MKFQLRTDWRNLCLEHLLLIFMAVALVIGIYLGVALRPTVHADQLMTIWYLEFPSRLLTSMLLMFLLPLTVSSIETAVSNLGNRAAAKIVMATVAYSLISNSCATFLAMFSGLALQPGKRISIKPMDIDSNIIVHPLEMAMNVLNMCIPPNIVVAFFKQTIIHIVEEMPTNATTPDDKANLTNVPFPRDIFKESSVKLVNNFGMTTFSIVFGVILNHLGQEGVPMRRLFSSLHAALLTLLHFLMWFCPFGLLFSVVGPFLRTRDLFELLQLMGSYVLCFLLTYFIHSFIILPFIFLALTRRNPFKIGFYALIPILNALGIASSFATMPLTMDCLINKVKLDANIVKLAVPIASFVNYNGATAFFTIATLYIGQIRNHQFSAADILLVSIAAIFTTMSIGGVPYGGTVSLYIVLRSIGIDASDVGLILAIDWLQDKVQTAVNVWSDIIGISIIDHHFKGLAKRTTAKSISVRTSNK